MSKNVTIDGSTYVVAESGDAVPWAPNETATIEALANKGTWKTAAATVVDTIATFADTAGNKLKASGIAVANITTNATNIGLRTIITSIVNDLTTGGVAVPLSAQQGVVLQANIIAIKNAVDPLGIPKPYIGTTAPTNHVLADSKTIGSTVAAGDYAGTAYEALYTALWTNAGIADTSGHWMTDTGAKGGSASIDFAANRTITMDYSGAVLRAIGAGVGWTELTEANTINAKQDDAMQGHKHSVTGSSFVQTGGVTPGAASYYGTSGTIVVGDPTIDGTNGTPRTDKETRMKNIGVNIIFRYQ